MGFFTPVWKTENYHKADRVVAKINNQEKLKRIAREAKYDCVRETALSKITDQAVLAEFALDDPIYNMRYTAMKKIVDQNILAKIAQTDKNQEIRVFAVKRLSDQAVIADVAQGAKYSDARITAAEKLDDKALAQRVYADVAQSGDNGFTRVDAADRLNDKILAQRTYTDVARNGDKVSAPMLTRNKVSCFVRMLAIEKITDLNLAQRMYIDIAKTARYTGSDRMEAAKHVIDQKLLQEVYMELFINEYGSIQNKAFSALTDKERLIQLTKAPYSDYVRETACIKAFGQHDFGAKCSCRVCGTTQHDFRHNPGHNPDLYPRKAQDGKYLETCSHCRAIRVEHIHSCLGCGGFGQIVQSDVYTCVDCGGAGETREVVMYMPE